MLDDLAVGRTVGFRLGNGFVKVRVERFARGIDFFQTRFNEHILELLIDHIDAGLQRLDRIGLGSLRRRLRHVKIIQHGDKLLEQRFIGEFDCLLFFASRALLEIFEIGGGAQQPLPMFVGFGGALLEFLELFGVDRTRLERHQRFRRI